MSKTHTNDLRTSVSAITAKENSEELEAPIALSADDLESVAAGVATRIGGIGPIFGLIRVPT